jgi:hypothetical protein
MSCRYTHYGESRTEISRKTFWVHWLKYDETELRNTLTICYEASKVEMFFISMVLPAHSRPRHVIKFRNHFSQTVRLLGRVISPSQSRYLNKAQHKHRINAYTLQTYMHWVGFEPTITAFERTKTVHALDCGATVTGQSTTVHLWKQELRSTWVSDIFTKGEKINFNIQLIKKYSSLL